MDVIQFQEKLRNICELGKQTGNMLTHEQIREHFASTDLETSQMVKVLQYLKLQGIAIEGEENASQTELEEEPQPESKGTSIPLTPEWIENETGERVESTPHAMEKYTMPTPELPPMSLLRRKTV